MLWLPFSSRCSLRLDSPAHSQFICHHLTTGLMLHYALAMLLLPSSAARVFSMLQRLPIL
jgi:hypothetical protein